MASSSVGVRPSLDRKIVRELQRGTFADPFGVLGPHIVGDRFFVTTLQPRAKSVTLIDGAGDPIAVAGRVGSTDVFEAVLEGPSSGYRLRVEHPDSTVDLDDPYRFPSPLGELDLHLLGEGAHFELYRKLGAHPLSLDGADGVHFAVWAPNAKRVSVVGDFNDWDGRCHVMRRHPSAGLWDIFLPGVPVRARYKFELLGPDGELLPLKADPYGSFAEQPPGNASIVYASDYHWTDRDWMSNPVRALAFDSPVSIYEVHLGSWKRKVDDGGRTLTYRELADALVPYVGEMRFTHVELLPISEHPFAGSWGYQPTGLFAPTSRFGEPDDFRYFVDRCHQAGIGVIADWVGAHFPGDSHGLGRFDGTALYEHEDPRRGLHVDWDTLIFNYGRVEVLNYLIANAIYWVREFHIDALRMDAVASMLYLDYSREDGEWVPNEHGGNQNLEAVRFLERVNELVHAEGAATIAEESTAWQGVSRPVRDGGLGFSYKWNMGWMNDTLAYVKEDPIHRKFHHDRMAFGLIYAFSENFILPLSHDEVVHGKRSLLGRMPGDDWQRFATLRCYYAFMFAHPGKKLLFMGNEFAQQSEWNHDRSLDWHLLEDARHAGVSRLVADLNRLYAELKPLHQRDCESGGFQWIDWNDRDNSVLSWIRYDREGNWVVCLSNFTPVVRTDYRIGVPRPSACRELLNTDATEYGGSGCGNQGMVRETSGEGYSGQPASIWVTLPPLATVYLGPEPG